MAPAGLHKSDGRPDEHHRHRAHQEVRRRNEVGVENREELDIGGLLHAVLQSAGLETLAGGAVKDLDVVAFGPELVGDPVDKCARVIGGVVQHLDRVAILRVFHGGDGAHDALGHVILVIKRDLGNDMGQVGRRVFLAELSRDDVLLAMGGLVTADEEEQGVIEVKSEQQQDAGRDEVRCQ